MLTDVKSTCIKIMTDVIYKETPSTMGVFGSITFSHTPEEAMSGGLAKACVPTKINPVEEKLSFLIARHMFCKGTGLAPYLSIKLVAKTSSSSS